MGGRLCMERGFVEKISDIMYTYYVDNINYLGSEKWQTNLHIFAVVLLMQKKSIMYAIFVA